jgi:hypothetical protein
LNDGSGQEQTKIISSQRRVNQSQMPPIGSTASEENPAARRFAKSSLLGWPLWWLALLVAALLLVFEPVVVARPGLGLPFLAAYVLIVITSFAALVAGLRRVRSRAKAIACGVLGSVVQVALLLSVVMALGVQQQTARAAWHEQGNVSFRELACKGYEKGAPARVAAARWENDVLVIRAPACVNCSLRVESVRAIVEGDTVSITITPERASGPVAACDCERALDIRIASLPKRDYAIRGIQPVQGCI